MTEEQRLEQFHYRVAHLLGATAYPFFGWFSQEFLNVSFDSLKHRLGVTVVSAMMFLLSFKIDFIAKNLRYSILIISCWAMYDYLGFFVQSEYHYYFSIGLTALPFIILTCLFRSQDIIIFFIFMLGAGAKWFNGLNAIFIFTYLILITLAVSVYFLVTKSRLNLLRRVRENLDQLTQKQTLIEEKNKSLIKIGELAAQVAHDIRSSVTALEAVSQMLGDEIDPNKKKLIKNAAQRINDIANNLVSEYRENLTKDLASLKIDRNITLNSLIEDIVEEKKLSLDSKCKIIIKAPESITIPEKINPTEFQRVISNLINNSIESFNKENGFVDVELSHIDNKVRIRIRDNGKGIPQDQISTVFDKGVTSKSTGAGLGLSHAKAYFSSIGGVISIESSSSSGTTILAYI